MKRVFFILMCLIGGLSHSIAQNYYGDYDISNYSSQRSNATMTFNNQSNYHMTVKILKLQGGLYDIVDLPARSTETVNFYSSATYKMKIKAMIGGKASFHRGGIFSVTSTPERWSQGEITFKITVSKRVGGSGLGPTISKKEFDSDN